MNVQYLERDTKPRLAYVYTPAQADEKSLPPVVFMGGYRSDMNGTKANYFEQQCAAREQAYLRFDYSGHGLSDGVFEDGTIGEWAQDAQDVLAHVIKEPAILVGSSMGGWIALLVAASMPEKVAGLIGIAAAPDFTEEIYHERLDEDQRDVLKEKGLVMVENDYSDEPYSFTRDFYEDGKANLILSGNHNVSYPMRLIQGRQDRDVPWQTAEKIRQAYGLAETDVIYVEDGDHRLSRPQDLVLIDEKIQALSAQVYKS